MWVQVDICPEHVLKHTLESLQTILKKPGVKKRPFMVCTSLLLNMRRCRAVLTRPLMSGGNTCGCTLHLPHSASSWSTTAGGSLDTRDMGQPSFCRLA